MWGVSLERIPSLSPCLLSSRRRIAISPTVTLALIVSVPCTGLGYEIGGPTRSDALPPDTYIVTSGHSGYNCDPDTPLETGRCQLDLHALRWDHASQNWTRSKTRPNIGSFSSNFSDDVMWDMPVYAPVDGQVVACWRNLPDDDVDGDSSNCPGGASVCISGGNHVNILTDDGHLVFFGHLKQGSIPSALCPITDTYLYNSDGKTCGLPGWSGLRNGSRLDLRNIAPRTVRKGDYLGTIGTSGAGQGVHLHMHVKSYSQDSNGNHCEVTDGFLPLEFSESSYQVRTPGLEPDTQWTRLTQDRLPINGSSFLLWPDPVGPRTGEALLSTGTRPSVALTAEGGLVAYRNSSGSLSATAFRTPGTSLSVGASDHAGAVSEVAASSIGSGRHVAVGARNGSGRFQLIPYYISSTGQLSRGSGYTAGTADKIALTPSPQHTGVVAAMRNGAGGISVIDFSTPVQGGSISVSRNGSAASSISVKRVAAATIRRGRGLNQGYGAFSGVITAERRHDDRLVLRSWSVSSQGSVQLLDGGAASLGGAPLLVRDVDISVVGAGSREYAVTSARRLSDDHLIVQTWEVRRGGDVRLIETHNAGPISKVAVAEGGDYDALTAIRDSSGNLALLSWTVDRDQPLGRLRRSGKRQFTSVGDVDVAARASDDYAVAAFVDSSGRIKVARFETNYDNSY